MLGKAISFAFRNSIYNANTTGSPLKYYTPSLIKTLPLPLSLKQHILFWQEGGGGYKMWENMLIYLIELSISGILIWSMTNPLLFNSYETQETFVKYVA